jgi:hypothetical protein
VRPTESVPTEESVSAEKSVPAEEEPISQELDWVDPSLGGPYPWTTDHAQEQAALFHKEDPDFAAGVRELVAQEEGTESIETV